MYLVLTDETNREEKGTTFFLMGGVAVPANAAQELNVQIDGIREKYGYRVEDSLKYARASKPDQISNDNFNSAKSAVLDLCVQFKVSIFLYACHHLIAENKGQIEKFQWGSNALLWQINKFLASEKSFAWVLQDRHPVEGEFAYYRQRFSESRPIHPDKYKLDCIVGFGSTCDGASHLASIADIALGSYRFCINNPTKDVVNGILMPKLLRSTWGSPDCVGKGIGIFPLGVVNKKECQADYANLYSQIAKYSHA